MTRRDTREPPPPCGAGAGSGGRANAPTPETHEGIGWTPRVSQARQKEFVRTKLRAREMRNEPTTAEKDMWRLLRSLNREGAHFRRQVAVAYFVYDFGDYSAHLLIEVDGAIHELEDVAAQDRRKEAHAAMHGFRVLRFTNAEACGRADWVIARVRAALADRGAPSSPVEEGREEGRARPDAHGKVASRSDSPSPPAPPHQGEGGRS
ncbi:MAG: endonuclease domain-containing protein [Caulobacteraceae bacterium]